MAKIAVFSAGSWGTAFSLVLADAGHDVTMWARRERVVHSINRRHENPDYFPGIRLPAGIRASTDPSTAIDGADYVVLSVPSQTLRENLTMWKPLLDPDATFISLMKGVELGTTRRMTQVISEVTGAPPDKVVVVSGPNLAGEIMRREPTATVVACADEGVAKQVQALMHTRRFRPYRSVDVVGCELGGAYKNVIGLCVGMAIGMGFGDNTTASIITRGLAETARLGRSLGADPLTLMGLAGMGDLVATCSSPLSRNRTFGEKLGQGFSAAQIYATTRQVAEGARSCGALAALARQHEVYAPITHYVDAVVRGDITPRDLVDAFEEIEAKRERD